MVYKSYGASVLLTAIILIVMHGAHAQTRDTSPKALKKLSMEELMNLEVTSVSKRPEKLSAVSSAVQIITQEDIRQAGVTSVAEALKLATNLQVAQVNASQWAISARGFNNVLANKLLVLIDGRTVYTPLYAGVFWDVQNLILEDIDHIEVISGPGGTLWGSNAVNGVINIITKNTKDTQGIFAEAAAGSKLQGLGSLRYGGKISDKLHFKIYGTTFKRGATQINDTSARDDWNMAQAGARLDWDASEKDVVTVQSNLYSDRPDPDGGHPVIASGSNVVGKWNHIVSDRADYQLKLYYDQTFRDFRNNFTENLRTYDLDWQHRFRHGKRGELIWGAGYRFLDHSVKNLPLFGFFPGHKQLHLFNLFLQEEFTLIPDRIRVTIGAKVEHYTYTAFQYQPNVRLAYTAGSHHTLWAAASRAVRLPARIDRDFGVSIAPGFVVIQGNENMKAETVVAYELGWRWQPLEKISLSLSSFYNLYDNLRSAEPGTNAGGFPITFGNGVKGKSYGAELSVLFPVTSYWKIRAGYTLLKKDLVIKPGSSDLNAATAESNDPRNQFLFQSNINLLKRMEFGVLFRYIDDLPKPAVDHYVGLDARLSWKVTQALEVSVVGQNLAGKTHIEFIDASHPPHRIERSIYGKIVVRY
jgi:iron complex outermembrane receptor protein